MIKQGETRQKISDSTTFTFPTHFHKLWSGELLFLIISSFKGLLHFFQKVRTFVNNLQ